MSKFLPKSNLFSSCFIFLSIFLLTAQDSIQSVLSFLFSFNASIKISTPFCSKSLKPTLKISKFLSFWINFPKLSHSSDVRLQWSRYNSVKVSFSSKASTNAGIPSEISWSKRRRVNFFLVYIFTFFFNTWNI